MALLLIATLAGATLQSAAGFGFALVLAPAALAVLEPDEAITTLLALGLALNLLILLSERRPRMLLSTELRPLLAWAMPGVIIGVLVLAAVERPELQIAVGALVIVAVGSRFLGGAAEGGGGGLLRAAAGLSTGVLTTTTGTSGPPLLLWFERIGATPAELRDSLSASFLVLNGFGTLALLAPGGAALEIDPLRVAILLVVTLIGQRFGRAIFLRLDPALFRRVGFVLVLAAGLASIVAGLAS